MAKEGLEGRSATARGGVAQISSKKLCVTEPLPGTDRNLFGIKNITMDNQQKLYECPECHLKYKDEEWTKKCEVWCRERHSCNLEITAHAEKSEGDTPQS